MVDFTKIDDIDRRILRSLQANGRLTIHDLSAEVGLSPSPCSRRVKQLEDAGVITGYTALLDEALMGFGVSVFVSVKLDRQVDDALNRFETTVSGYPEVVDCWLMTGNRDYLLRVVTRDLVEFEAFLTGRLTKVEGVASIESSIPLRRIKGEQTRAA